MTDEQLPPAKLSVLMALLVLLCGCLASVPPRDQRSFFLGSWQDTRDPDYFLRVEPTRLSIAFDGQVRSIAKVVGLSTQVILLCEFGRDKRREVSQRDNELILHNPDTGETRRLRRLRETPSALVLRPFPIPEIFPLAESEVSAIQKELWRRLQEDQKSIGVIRIPADPNEPSWMVPRETAIPHSTFTAEQSLHQAEVTGDNTRYLKDVISRVGWIDVRRFGYPASNAAFLLVQHTYDLPLMMAVLPQLKADVDADRTEGETYALLYDRLHLALGEKQLYGSQVFDDNNGEKAVFPVEEPSRLDERRAAMRMPPIAEYMKAWGSTEVRISTACSAGRD